MNKMQKSGVPWADYRWNPMEGCSPVSAGCKNCYAANMARRFHRHWGSPLFHPEKLGEPEATKEPGRVFVCSTSDLFHERAEVSGVLAVLKAMHRAPWHTYIFCTKRPHLMQKVFALRAAPANWWLLTTIETQADADLRVPILQNTNAVVRGVSCEPLLEEIDLQYSAFNGADDLWKLQDINWVIAGPETGSGKRYCDSNWITMLSLQAKKAGVPFFDKSESYIRREFPKV